MANPTPEEILERIKADGPADFYMVYINGSRQGALCFRTTEGLLAALRRLDGSRDQVEVGACNWDD